MDRYELSERFAMMWKRSREISGKSQEYMARSLGVSKSTVQNWESGVSCPSQENGFLWFQACDLQPLPFYLNILYHDSFSGLKSSSDDERIEAALLQIIKDLPTDQKRKLLYLLCGDHGSSVVGMIEMITAHLQAPLRDRVNVAQSIATNYEIASETGKIRQPEHIQPDMDILSLAIGRGKDAVKHGKESYSALIEKE